MRAGLAAAGRLLSAAAAFAMVTAGFAQPPRAAARERRMSFHNRLLLNRAAVTGLRSLEVMLLAGGPPINGDAAVSEVRARVERIAGRVLRTESAIGYMRVEIPTERLLELIEAPVVEAYQISSLSKGTWYRDGPPLSNAQMYRQYEVTPVAATAPETAHTELPSLSIAESREAGFTADDAGVGEWMTEHPAFDGRGVTIALLENALPWFADPSFRSAKTLDGEDVPKIAGILNTLAPGEPDDTRVRLTTLVDAAKSWTRVGDRTYVFPHPGSYRFGVLRMPAGGNVIHEFAVTEEQTSHDVWIDANGDASFQDETPLADVNERFDPRFLKLTHPRKADVSFVMGRGREPHVVHIYMGKGSHQSMTLSVAAGSRTDDSLAFGVAPNARVLLVRMSTSETALSRVCEAFIEAAQRPDVDVIDSSTGIAFVPDTGADFGATFFRRLVEVYQKPIVIAASNNYLRIGTANHGGTALSAGGLLSPRTWAALFGGRSIDRLIAHPSAAAGPSLDGAIKPDFVAPMERLAVDLPWNADISAVPSNAPVRRIPPGYQVSCCTSATSPYTAGLLALLISAARQSNVSCTASALSRAMRMSARPIPEAQAHEQGNGAVDVNAAWLALAHAYEPPRIIASAAIVHPLAQYAARGSEGQAILELEGWTAGLSGTRTITFHRESGPAQPLAYRLEWTAGDGTFNSDSSITLPLGRPVALAVRIHPMSSGAHSALLTLREAGTNEIAFRTQATIVAAEEFDATGSLRLTGTVGLMRQRMLYIHVPGGVAALSFELEITKGVVMPSIVPPHGLFPAYFGHVYPKDALSIGKGRHDVRLPNPEPGTWTFQMANDSTWFHIPGNPVLPDDADAEYVLTVRLSAASLAASRAGNGAVAVDIENRGNAVAEPVLQASDGQLASHHGSFLRNGLPNSFTIDVPAGASTLSLQLRAGEPDTKTELYLYDCSTGECFAYNIGFPAARAHTMVVRKPNAGRWVAAVNAAPFPTGPGTFVLDEIVTSGTPVRMKSSPHASGERWRQQMDDHAPPVTDGQTPIVLIELMDAAAERAEAEHPWAPAPFYIPLRDRPVALGTAIYRK